MRICRTLLIYCISFTVVWIAGTAMDLACGPEIDPYDYYISFFHNNLQGEKAYKPFYFTEYRFVYDDNEPASEASINANEWAVYLGRDVSANDVARAMYRLDHKTDAWLENGYLKSGEHLPDTLLKNTFLRAIMLKRNTTALKYFRFAKSVEAIANTTGDKWDPKPLDSVALRREGSIALRNALAEKDRFIQLRYFYQAQRLFHYGYGYKEALGIYNHYIDAAASGSHVKGWAMGLKAGELRRLKDTVQAAYLFSRVFAQYPERRIQAFQNYSYIHAPQADVIKLAANNSEKAVISAIGGFGNPELTMEPLHNVYRFDAESPMIGVLLVREVNKIEAKFLTAELSKTGINNNYYTGSINKQEPEQLAHIGRLLNFCRQLVNERKYPDYNIGNLAGAYLSWIQGDNSGGFAWLRAMNNENLTPAMNDQKQIIQLLLSAQNIQKLNDINEAQLLPALKWLDAKVKAEPKLKTGDNFELYGFGDKHKFTYTARDFYQQILAPAYLRQGDTTKAALAINKGSSDVTMTDFWQNHLHSSQLLRLIRWKRTPPSLPYNAFLAERLNQVKLNYLENLLGTAYLREHQYPRAAAAFKLVDAATLNKFPEDYERGDPFIDRINDYPKIQHYGKTKGYNKLQFAEAMNDLEQKIKTDEKNAPTYYYRYATGLYNTSHYGNAWYLISYDWSSTDFGRTELYSYDADYIKTRNAEKYYLLARSLSNNEEFKAKCTFMAAKCRQKQVVAPSYMDTEYLQAQKQYLLKLKSNEYFDELKDNYKKTAFFKKAMSDCSYLKDFNIN